MRKQFSDEEKISNSINRRLTKIASAALMLILVFVLTGCTQDNSGSTDVSSPVVYENNYPNNTDASSESNDHDNSNSDAYDNTDGTLDDEINGEKSDESIDEVIDGAINDTEDIISSIIINEVLASNSKYSEHDGSYYDMVELYNASEEGVWLGNFYLSDSKKNLTKYRLPETELAPGECFVVYCTGKYCVKCELDAPFELSYFGEKLYVSNLEGEVVDSISYPELRKNVSYGREDGGELCVYETPSIGKTNSDGLHGMAEAPAVSLAPGNYTGTQKVSFLSDSVIRYTLDGSEPGKNSKIWNGEPIEISETCAIRAYAVKEGYLDSNAVTYSYFIDEPDYELDMLMVSVDLNDFDTMNENYKSNTKYPAAISLFSEGKLQFQINCAIQNFGCTSRMYDKKSYKIKFSSNYGPSKLRYKLFEDRDIDEFGAIVLRSGSQDVDGAMLRDEYISSLSIKDGLVTDVLVQAYRPINLYINGEYWGIYYIRERIDKDMVASHYDCDPEEVTIVEQNTEVKCGNNAKEWKNLWQYIKDNSLTDEANYEYVKSIVNPESVADYYIIQLWCGNIDMDNVRVCKAGDDKWRYVLYDLDLSLVRPEEGTVNRILGAFNSGLPNFNGLVYKLLQNEEFEEMFRERLLNMCATVYSDDNALMYLDEMAKMIEHDMQYNCERWIGRDTSNKISYRSYNSWIDELAALRRLVTGRAQYLTEDYTETKK